MAVVVWEPVQYYDAIFRSPEDKVFVIVFFIFQVMADKAFVFVIESLDVGDTPRCPQIF